MEQFSVENPSFESGDDPSLNCRFSLPKPKENGETKEAKDIEYRKCGWLCFQPDFLQRFRTAKWVLFWLCWAGAIQGNIYFFVVNVLITYYLRLNVENDYQGITGDISH